MTAPIESGGNNKAVRHVGNCITCRQLHHGKSTLEAAAMQHLLQQRDSAAALETAWQFSGFDNSIVVASPTAASATALWHCGAAALLTAWQCSSYNNSLAGAAALVTAATLSKMETASWAVVASAAAAA